MRYVVLALCAIAAAGCRREAPAPKYYTVDAETAGRLSGTVRFAGKAPPARPISMDADEACEKLHATAVREESVSTGEAGALANAVVYIKSGLEGKTFEPPKEAVVLDQRGCMFVPRVVPLRTGQILQVRNSDPVSHNIHPRPANNYEWNQQQQPGAPDLQRRFVRPEIAIPVRCNIHSWMRSYIAVLDHPWFAVTTASGAFEWPSVPAGDYTVAVWHETLGELTQNVTLGARGQQTLDFVFRSAPQPR